MIFKVEDLSKTDKLLGSFWKDFPSIPGVIEIAILIFKNVLRQKKRNKEKQVERTVPSFFFKGLFSYGMLMTFKYIRRMVVSEI